MAGDDGQTLVFQSARRALECAIAIQTAVAARLGGVRAAFASVYTPVSRSRGGDFFGRLVNLAARVAAQAKGAEILVSSVIRELLQGAGELALDVGREVQLKGSPARTGSLR